MIGLISTKRLMFLAFVMSAVWLAGCTTAKKAPPKYEEGYFPEPKVRTSVSVGEVMVSKFNYTAEEVAVLLSASESSMWLGRPSLPANSKLVKATSAEGTLYCYYVPGTISPCFADQDMNGDFESEYNFSNISGVVADVGDIDPIPYRIAGAIIQDGFKYELVYQGIDANTVRIAYREYSDNLVRPAFHQDLTYTLEEGETQVSFRGVRLTIYSASNNQVEFTVNSGFK
tara:strand:- start:798 stop:1484 length:687 start_codon:yes stop_codon:yes gene_type:complete